VRPTGQRERRAHARAVGADSSVPTGSERERRDARARVGAGRWARLLEGGRARAGGQLAGPVLG
jgi:hypothetical protein